MTDRKFSRRRRWAAPGIAGWLLLILLGVSPGVADDVKIGNFTFDPPEITVTTGATVTWTNDDDIPHTVVGKERPFRSKTLDTDDQFSFTFTTPGVYEYFCSLHPHMVGRIVVQATTGGKPSP